MQSIWNIYKWEVGKERRSAGIKMRKNTHRKISGIHCNNVSVTEVKSLLTNLVLHSFISHTHTHSSRSVQRWQFSLRPRRTIPRIYTEELLVVHRFCCCIISVFLHYWIVLNHLIMILKYLLKSWREKMFVALYSNEKISFFYMSFFFMSSE